ncbi:DUF4148 domain-containing protein [Paraburkholderia sp.]|uniref:DUF4148 domain-containing protein n=1 Tax=Paraburkholderia sp. TaxID=1926495 RepID=UPI003D6EEB0C
MKSLVSAVIVAALAVPAVSFAQQSNAPVTRAQVRAELVAAQKAGLLSQADPVYPKNAVDQRAVVEVAQQTQPEVGGAMGGRSESGARIAPDNGIFSTYRGQ